MNLNILKNLNIKYQLAHCSLAHVHVCFAFKTILVNIHTCITWLRESGFSSKWPWGRFIPHVRWSRKLRFLFAEEGRSGTILTWTFLRKYVMPYSIQCSLSFNAVKGKAHASYRWVTPIHPIVAFSMVLTYMKNYFEEKYQEQNSGDCVYSVYHKPMWESNWIRHS